MFSKKSFAILGMFQIVSLLLGACGVGAQATQAPTEAPQDINAIYTAAAETAKARLTEIAANATPTYTPQPVQLEATATDQQSLVQITITMTESNASGGLPTQEVVATATLGLVATETLLPGLPTNTPGTGLFTPIPTITTAPTAGTINTGPVCKNAAFEGDVTIPDGTLLNPWEKFVKTWRMRNSGTCNWDEGFSFKPWSGPSSMANHEHAYNIRKKDKFIPAGAVIDIAIEMYAPGDPGEYVAHWKWFDDQGQPFGGDFTVVIKVVK